MYETIKDILFHSHNTRSEQLAEGWERGYNLMMPIGPYTLSVAVGDGAYCLPRKTLEDIREYKALECAILKDIDVMGVDHMLGVREINDTFGPEVAKLCEGYGFGEDTSIGEMLANGSTVLPYITWEQVIMVANAIDRHSPEGKDLI